MRAQLYGVLPTAPRAGLIEIVRDATPLTELARVALAPRALDRLVASAAASFTTARVLGVRDRHSDNILVLPSGVLFHIDFGRVLGDTVPLLDATDFAVTEDLRAKLSAAGAPDGDERWGAFCEACGAAFAALWGARRFVAAFVRAALGSPDGASPDGGDRAAKVDAHLRRVLFVDGVRTRREAAAHMAAIADSAPGALATTVKNHVHGYAQAFKAAIGSSPGSDG